MVTKIKTIDTTPFRFEVEKVNPLFSKSKIYVMYHGKNRNKSKISKEVVEKSLHTIKNIPIVGEFIERDEEGNFGDHGGKIEITNKDIKFIQTTKPIGVVPESAKVYWEIIKDKKEIEREYLVIDGAYVWNRYEEEVRTLRDDNFGQSMELEVFDGDWNEEEDLYEIKDFAFSALCILGIDKNGEGHVEPAFEDAKIITYSLDKDSFRKEFSQMLQELKFSLSKEEDQEKEVSHVLKKLLEKYSLTVEQLTEKGIVFNEISEEELEAKIIEVFEIEVQDGEETPVVEPEVVEEEDGEGEEAPVVEPEVVEEDEQIDFEAKVKDLEDELVKANDKIATLTQEVNDLNDFKLNVEKSQHEDKVKELFSNFQLTEEDVKDVDIHAFSYEQLEEKCYAILGKKLASKKNFSKSKDQGGIRIDIKSEENQDEQIKPYGGLFDKYNKKD